jgi:dipeptidyl aminopeptidase/acylaminoacyl peptidase
MSRPEPVFRTLSADRLTAALDEVGGPARPDYLDTIVTQASQTRQRPAWTFPERWIPMTIALRPAAVPRALLYSLVVIAALLALLVASLLLAGASPSVPVAPVVQNGLIAFDANDGIDVAAPDGSAKRLLIPGTANYDPVWSPDGTHLAYESTGPGSSWQLIVVNADGSQPVTVASATQGSTSATVAWSPNGKTIAYSAPTAQTGTCAGQGTYNGDFCTSRIFVAAADGSGAHPIGDPTLDARSPVWSPIGDQIAFGGGNASQMVHLYVMDASGTNVRQVGDVGGTDWAFLRNSWSYDGALIAVQAGAAGNPQASDIWTIPVDGTTATDVGSDSLLPTWAPDRNALAWQNAHVVLMDVGASAVVLPPPGGFPTWSPDGTLLAAPGPSGLNVMGLDGVIHATIPGATDKSNWQRVIVTP